MRGGELRKIVSRYILCAAGIAVLLLVLNIAVLLVFFAWQIPRQGESSRFDIARISQGLARTGDGYAFDAQAHELYAGRYQWALLLDARGTGIWSLDLPEEVPVRYTSADIAGFSRWYLRDYPVTVWEHGEGGLLILGSPKGSMVKYAEQLRSSTMDAMLWLLPAVLLLHVVAAVGLAVLFGRRMYRNLRPVADAISDIAEQKAVNLPTGGLLGGLSDKLNNTSQALQSQRAALEKRDRTRTEWIAGISHDIRTPLSMVMGYASQLEEDAALPPAQRLQARVIRRQSRRMKELVENLNLASRLEYGWQPVSPRPVALAALVRSTVTEYLNSGWDEHFDIAVEIAQDAAAATIQGDEFLLRRAIYNLVDNCIRHNGQGCRIAVSLYRDAPSVVLAIEDNGKGMTGRELARLQGENAPVLQGNGHGLGLGIVRKIAQIHGGSVRFESAAGRGLRVELAFSGQREGDTGLRG